MTNSRVFNYAGIALLTFFAAVTALSQVNPTGAPQRATLPPGKIQLPPQYVYESRRGKDSHVGAIVRSDGFTISHDIGRMAANYASKYFPEHFDRLRKQTHLNTESIETDIQTLQGKIVWRQRLRINGDEVMVVLLKDSTLIASFVNSYANFIANADTSDKIGDFFLIVLTYQPPGKER